MNGRLLFLIALLPAGLAPARADDAPPAPETVQPPTSPSDVYPQVSCTSNDAAACADALQLATDTREALAKILQLGPTWKFPVNIHVLTPDDPMTAKINREAVQAIAHGETMEIEAVVPIQDPDAREFIQRQYVTALLWERFFAKTKTFDSSTKLDIVPLWLVEGLREWVNEDPTHNREAIARRALQNQTAPTLTEITSWKKLSDDRLYGLWQRAFSYYLVDSLVRGDARRQEFQQWLDSFSSPNGSGQLNFPTEANWRQELADASARGHNVVYTWQETADAFDADATVTYAESKSAPVQTCTLDDLGTRKLTPALLEAVRERFDVITALELRGDSDWEPIFEAYRRAMAALMDKEYVPSSPRLVDNDRPQVLMPRNAPRLLAEARALREAEVANHQKLVDYLNWFVVTRDFGPTTSRFEEYFVAAKQTEQVVADPTHPNPIRATLLQVESRL